MTTYRKTVHEVIGVKERDIDIIVTRQSVWETASSPIHLPSNVDLAGHWPFNEGSGMIAYDHSKYGNHGTLVNMEEEDWVDGVVGKCLDFDGVNDYIKIPHSAELGSDVSRTISFWIKAPLSQPDDYPRVISKPITYYLFKQVGLNRLMCRIYDGANVGEVRIDNLFDDTLHFGTVVIDRTNQKMHGYLDSVLVATDGDISNVGDTSGTNNLTIGGHEGSHPLDGLMDEVRIYNRALTAGEIKALYLFPSGPTTWSENKIIQKDE